MAEARNVFIFIINIKYEAYTIQYSYYINAAHA